MYGVYIVLQNFTVFQQNLIIHCICYTEFSLFILILSFLPIQNVYLKVTAYQRIML